MRHVGENRLRALDGLPEVSHPIAQLRAETGQLLADLLRLPGCVGDSRRGAVDRTGQAKLVEPPGQALRLPQRLGVVLCGR